MKPFPKTRRHELPSLPLRGKERHPRRKSLFVAGAFLLAGCATTLTLRDLNNYTLKNEFAPAAEHIEKQKKSFGENNALLYHLDRGMLLHLANRYSDSGQALENAKRVAQELFTKSVTAHLSTFLVNDLMTPYYGEDFERALIFVFSAINYAAQNKGEAALVECRQLDSFFRALRFDGERSAYHDDAFARYLAGLLYENQGETNDAYISYMKSLEGYDDYATFYKTPRPPRLVQDALRTARQLGFSDKVADIQRRWGPVPPPLSPDEETGEVVLLHYSGLGPEKVDSFFEISVFKGWPYVEQVSTKSQDDTQVEQARAVFRSLGADKMIRIAFPKYRRNEVRIQRVEVQSGSSTVRGELVEDVGAIAVRNLEDRVLRTRVKAISRAVVKYLLSQQIAHTVEKNGNENLGFIVRTILQAASAATEVADKRAWRTLPDQISMARLSLPPGSQSLTVRFLDAQGLLIESREVNSVTVTPGKKTFIIARTAV
jgi:tetratricopeptide (TPR) repeat protein